VQPRATLGLSLGHLLPTPGTVAYVYTAWLVRLDTGEGRTVVHLCGRLPELYRFFEDSDGCRDRYR
jgi:hypothetical protein